MLTSVKIIGPYPATDAIASVAVPLVGAGEEVCVTAIPLDENGELMPAWKMSLFAWAEDTERVALRRGVLSADEAVGILGKVGGSSTLTVTLTEAESATQASTSITVFS